MDPLRCCQIQQALKNTKLKQTSLRRLISSPLSLIKSPLNPTDTVRAVRECLPSRPPPPARYSSPPSVIITRPKMPANQTKQRLTNLPLLDTSPPIVPHQSSSLAWTCWPPSPSCPPFPLPAPTIPATQPSDPRDWRCAALVTCLPILQSARILTAGTPPVPLLATTPTWPGWACRVSRQATSSFWRATRCIRLLLWGYPELLLSLFPPHSLSHSWPPTPSSWGRGEPSDLQVIPVPCHH